MQLNENHFDFCFQHFDKHRFEFSADYSKTIMLYFDDRFRRYADVIRTFVRRVSNEKTVCNCKFYDCVVYYARSNKTCFSRENDDFE